jgi:hypothetical protein
MFAGKILSGDVIVEKLNIRKDSMFGVYIQMDYRVFIMSAVGITGGG